MICEYCSNEFQNISALNKHKKNTKYCLILQSKVKSEYLCIHCNKSFSSENYLKNHETKCIDYFKNLILEKEKIILEKEKDFKNLILEKEKYFKNLILEKEKENKFLLEENIKLKTENSFLKTEHEDDKKHIKKLSIAPKIINNNNSNNNIINNTLINPIIDDISKIKEKIDNNLSINHIIDGQKGIATFAYDNLLKDQEGNVTYFCSDPSRGFFKYINENNEIVKDIQAKNLTRNLCKAGLVNKANDIAIASWTNEDGNIDNEKYNIICPKALEIRQLEMNNSTFKNELTSYTTVNKNITN